MGNAGSTWVQNNNSSDSLYNPSATNLTITGTYAAGLVGALIMLHSLKLYRLKFDGVRVLCDSAALASVFAALFTYIAFTGGDPSTSATRIAILNNCLSNGICQAVIQLCDNYLFYSRFRAIQRASKGQRVTIHCYIWVVLICTWLPTLTIIPFFYDTNTDAYTTGIVATNSIYSIGCIAYNFYFTSLCCRILWRVVLSKKAAEDHSVVAHMFEQRNMEGSALLHMLSTVHGFRLSFKDLESGVDRASSYFRRGSMPPEQDDNQELHLKLMIKPVNATVPAAGSGDQCIVTSGGTGDDEHNHNATAKIDNNVTRCAKQSPTATGTGTAAAGGAETEQSNNHSNNHSNNNSNNNSTNNSNKNEDGHGILVFSYSKWRLVVIAVKSIGHAFTSSFATLLCCYDPTGVGYAVWPLLIIAGMHLWFNVHLEQYVCPYDMSHFQSLNRTEREWAVCQQRMHEERRRRVLAGLPSQDVQEEEEEEKEKEKDAAPPISSFSEIETRLVQPRQLTWWL